MTKLVGQSNDLTATVTVGVTKDLIQIDAPLPHGHPALPAGGDDRHHSTTSSRLDTRRARQLRPSAGRRLPPGVAPS
ncbi:MAG: hypothetical protein ACTHMA_21380, partial [Thermomicrobiales bacterium]